MLTHTLGFPRVGAQRELKRVTEAYWARTQAPPRLAESPLSPTRRISMPAYELDRCTREEDKEEWKNLAIPELGRTSRSIYSLSANR